MKRRILILDFDGVICDSIKECLSVAYNTYLKVKKQSYKPSLKLRIPYHFKQSFLDNRYLVRPAREYFVLFKSFEDSSETVLSEKRFRALLKINAKACDNFEREFFKTRDYLRSASRGEWLMLNKVYPGVKQNIGKLKRFFKIYICTTKDRKSVKMILEKSKIKFSEKKIFSRENKLSKPSAAEYICRINHCKPKDVYFLDDNIIYLNELAHFGARSCLARWGYLSKDSIKQAGQKDYLIFRNFTETVSCLNNLNSR